MMKRLFTGSEDQEADFQDQVSVGSKNPAVSFLLDYPCLTPRHDEILNQGCHLCALLLTMVKIKEEENLVNPRCDCFRGKTCFLSYKMLHLGIHLSSPNPSLQSFTVKTPWAKPFLETVNVGFSFLQEGFYIFSQAFPRLSFSHTVWRLSSVGNGSRVLLHRSHSKRCERVFLSQEISISIGLAKGAAMQCLFTHICVNTAGASWLQLSCATSS